jgi:hypothetical protein
MATYTNTSKKQEEVALAPVDPYVATPAPTTPRGPIAAIHWYHVAATAWAPAPTSCAAAEAGEGAALLCCAQTLQQMCHLMMIMV